LVTPENRSRAVRAVAVAVSVALTGEVLFDQLHPRKRRMGLIDAGIEDTNDDAASRQWGGIRTDGFDAPRRCGCAWNRIARHVDRLDQFHRDYRRDSNDVGLLPHR
jgi:hypothetical protein